LRLRATVRGTSGPVVDIGVLAVERGRTGPPTRLLAPARVKCGPFKASGDTMPKIDISVPEHLEMQIAQLVEQGEFADREEAIEDLLSTGLRAYKTSGPMEDEDAGLEDDGMMGHEDEYVF
jgi:hypothetical protein